MPQSKLGTVKLFVVKLFLFIRSFEQKLINKLKTIKHLSKDVENIVESNANKKLFFRYRTVKNNKLPK